MSESDLELPANSALNSGTVDWVSVFNECAVDLESFVRRKLSGAGEVAVDDILQEVAITAQATGQKVEAGSEKAWLKGVANNKVKDYWRKVERRGALDQKYLADRSLSQEHEESPYEWVLALDDQRTVELALDKLADEEREALVEKYLNDRSCREIAEEKGISVKAIEYRLKKAREEMRGILKIFLKAN